MSEKTITAIYQEGVFHPTTPEEITLHEGEQVKLSIQKMDEETDDERAARVERIMNLTKHFFDDVDENEIKEIERAILRRVTFVGEENKAQFD